MRRTNASVSRTESDFVATSPATSICCRFDVSPSSARAWPISMRRCSSNCLTSSASSISRNKLLTAARERPTASAAA